MFPDGGATFPADDGWIYVANAETSAQLGGGASALRFDRQGRVVDAYRILGGTHRNCAGGSTPDGRWLSCEEIDRGRVWECDPTGQEPARARDELGWFQHEAAAVDPATGFVYMTEDERDGRLYRWGPKLGLQVASVSRAGTVKWATVPVPNPGPDEPATRHQVEGATPFAGGEGIAHDDGRMVFVTKHDGRVWQLELSSRPDFGGRVSVIHDPRTVASCLAGPDNVVVRSGAVVVAEDGGDMQLVVVEADGRSAPLLQLRGQPGSELTGPAFSPDGRFLYVSSQRGPAADGHHGVTYAIAGPFSRLFG